MILNSKYPIVVTAMNRVSDIKLAIACYKAGITPSLSFMNYVTDDKHILFDNFKNDLKQFVDETNSNNIIISTIIKVLTISEVINILNHFNIQHIEIIDVYQNSLDLIRDLKKEHRFNFIAKLSEPADTIVSQFEGIMLKGRKGAGAVNKNIDCLELEITNLRKKHPNVFLIASGGIGTSNDIQNLLDAGADAVGIGTLYAVSEESSISYKTKLKMLESSSNDIQFLNNSKQNALLFKNIDLKDDINNTKSLEIGIKSGFAGHVFVGHGIDHIDKIKTVEEITKELVKDLKNVY